MDEPPTATPNASVRTRRAVRWWPAAGIVVLAGGVLAAIWSSYGAQRQDRVVASYPVLLCALGSLWVWLLLLSRVPWKTRLGVTGLLLALGAAGASLLRIRGVSGDIVPVLAWRWTQEPEAGLPAAMGEGGTVALEGGSADYPQLLGPRRDGKIDGVVLADDWSARPPRELWRQPIGAGWSGFAVVGGAAVTQEQRGEDELVTCYDLRSGRLLWAHAERVRFSDPIAGVGPRATPTIDGGVVYACGASGVCVALDLASGRPVWARRVLEELRAEPPPYGVAASPLVLEDRVLVAGGRIGPTLVALRRDSGETLWTSGEDRAAYSSPIAVELAGRRQVLLFDAVAIAGYDLQDGRPLWRQAWPESTEVASQPVVLPGDRVFASSGYGVGGKLFQIERQPDGGYGVRRIWESLDLKAKFTDVVERDGFLYGLDDGILTCVDAADGRRRWKGGRYGHGQILLVGERILVLGERGEIALVAASPDGYRELGRRPALDGKTWNHPALAGSHLLVRNDREAGCYELPLR
ncbi:MAG TPA: PQQ-binding-like beta-propeller repeat protein [Candidatus Polarisedimenticolaceae bacterium]|nr:PQQ-binding-like beta-propeller repeat protein [Candidatus Polarisedimenticolaceae bacterium]